tara:strand:+ start:125 stop:310 length:186 start_codon:yes stop_codon:yes gene_type:complete
MDYTLNEIKIELFDKCNELVGEYMNTPYCEQIQNETLEEFQERSEKIKTKIFNELLLGKLN